MTLTMSHHLTNEYWELLEPNSPPLHELFHIQSQQLTQLQSANNALEEWAQETQSNIMDSAAKAVLSVVQAIFSNMLMLTGSHLLKSARSAELESFNGSKYKTKQFIQSVCCSV